MWKEVDSCPDDQTGLLRPHSSHLSLWDLPYHQAGEIVQKVRPILVLTLGPDMSPENPSTARSDP